MPQGSILGPLLFILYINDIRNASNLSKCILFADDTSTFMSHNNIQTLQTIFNHEMNKISEWLALNKLTLNIKKTNYMIFTKKSYTKDSINIDICGSTIRQVSNLKFLGVQIDENMNWGNI